MAKIIDLVDYRFKSEDEQISPMNKLKANYFQSTFIVYNIQKFNPKRQIQKNISIIPINNQMGSPIRRYQGLIQICLVGCQTNQTISIWLPINMLKIPNIQPSPMLIPSSISNSKAIPNKIFLKNPYKSPNSKSNNNQCTLTHNI